MYIYIKSEPELWTVGFFDPDGKWVSESDHGTPAEAAERVHWLNGGSVPIGAANGGQDMSSGEY